VRSTTARKTARGRVVQFKNYNREVQSGHKRAGHDPKLEIVSDSKIINNDPT